MNSRLDDLIRDVGEETFESLAYVLPLPPEEAATADAPMTTATVRFRGPFNGDLMLSVGSDMLDELAGNMLGIMDPEELSDEHRFDALKELLNVVCGNLLPKLAGPEAVFDVMAPQLLDDGDTDHPCDESACGEAVLDLDCGPARLVLFADTKAPAIAALAGDPVH